MSEAKVASVCGQYFNRDGSLTVYYEVLDPPSRQEITLPSKTLLAVAQSCLAALERAGKEPYGGQAQD